MKSKLARTRPRWSAAALTLTVAMLAVVIAHGQTAPAPTTQPAEATPPKTAKTYIVPIRDDITFATAGWLPGRLIQAKAAGAELVIFDFDTNGGAVGIVSGIIKTIREELADVRTVAFVNNKAISAGAWLALTCDELVMVPNGKLGDCSPVVIPGELKDHTREKIESYVRADFRLAAKTNGYSPAVLESMVRKDMEVWLVKKASSGQKQYVEATDTWRKRFREGSATKAGSTDSSGEWIFQRTVVPSGKVLMATTGDAVELGLARAIVRNLDDVKAFLGVTEEPVVLEQTDAPTTQPTTAPAKTSDEGYFLKYTPAVAPPTLPEKVTKAYVVPIRDDIMPTMADALKRKLVQMKGHGVELVIFDFNTNGGRVDVADEIAKIIREELADVRTVAFVNSKAISAGAWLALTCNELVMVPSGKIGDCAPVVMQGELKGHKREKVESYISADFRLAAEANGYPPAILESMVRRDIEVWLVQNTRTGEKQYVEATSEWRQRVSNDPHTETPATDGTKEWLFMRTVVPNGELLTATTSEGVEFGIVKAVAADMNEVKNLYNIVEEPVVLVDTWSEKFVAIMTSPAVTGILVMAALFFGYIEVNTPGFGVAGTIALILLGVLFGTRYLHGLAQWWEIAVFAIGVILLLLEVFVIPGFGIAGILGGIFCLVGLMAMLIANPPGELPIPTPGLEAQRFADGLFAIAVGFLCGLGLCIIAGRYLPKIPFAGRLVLAEASTDSLPADEDSAIRRIQPGTEGVLESDCRPAGRARFNSDLIDVVADGAFLKAGTRVLVQRTDGNRLVVTPVEKA